MANHEARNGDAGAGIDDIRKGIPIDPVLSSSNSCLVTDSDPDQIANDNQAAFLETEIELIVMR